jgi:hypothetical protein
MKQYIIDYKGNDDEYNDSDDEYNDSDDEITDAFNALIVNIDPSTLLDEDD